MDGVMAARLRWAIVAVMGNGGGNGRRQVSQWETATAGWWAKKRAMATVARAMATASRVAGDGDGDSDDNGDEAGE